MAGVIRVMALGGGSIPPARTEAGHGETRLGGVWRGSMGLGQARHGHF